MSSVTISSQKPIACSRRIVSRIGSSRPPSCAVVPIVEALEVDLVEIDPRADVLEHLRRAVAVRHVAGREPGGLRFLEDGDRPFAGDQRLVVGADDRRARPGAARRATSASGEAVERRRDRRRIAQRLRRHPVLAVRRSADRSRACRSCRPARRDRRGRTASSRSDRTARRRRSPTARAAVRPR